MSKILLLGVTFTITLSATQPVQAADDSSQLSKIKQNQALVNSPRMREQFPELTRADSEPAAISSRENRHETQLAKLSQNTALAHSPRVIEQYPSLAIVQQPSVSRATAGSVSADQQLAEVRENSALVHSPRVLEQFPQLILENQMKLENPRSMQVAPLK